MYFSKEHPGCSISGSGSILILADTGYTSTSTAGIPAGTADQRDNYAALDLDRMTELEAICATAAWMTVKITNL